VVMITLEMAQTHGDDVPPHCPLSLAKRKTQWY